MTLIPLNGETGLQPKGVEMAKPRREMSREEVLGIRQYYDAGYTIEFIAGKYRRHRDTISDVVNYRDAQARQTTEERTGVAGGPPAILKEEALEQQPQKWAAIRKALTKDLDMA